MSSFKLNIYTPQGVVINSMECTELTIPTVRGEINILADHTHVLTQLSNGILAAHTVEGVRYFSITAGLCKVLDGSIDILAYTSEAPEKIDLDRAKKAKELASKKLEDTLTDVELIKYTRKLERAETRIKLANLK